MKKLTLLAVFLCVAVVTYGQRIITHHKDALPFGSELTTPVPPPATSGLKSAGEVFFKETFDWADPSNPRGWSLPEGWQINEETDYGCLWTWRAGTDSIKGMYTFEPGHAYSLTPEDGYFVLPMDEYNYLDGIKTTNAATSWFQLPSIDCSAHPGVILSFRQFFRLYYTPNVKVMVSNDLGAHWASFDVSYETGTNVFCKNPYPEINISEVAAGQPNVWIRFAWTDMERYFWCIDDIQLMESYENDLKMENSWQYCIDLSDEDANEGFVYMMPNSQTGKDNFGGYTFAGAVLNAGLNDQEGCKVNVKVFKNGTLAYNETSEARDIWALERDTFRINTVFNPTGYGNYKMVLTAQADLEDGRPSDNTYTDTYYVTDSMYSFCDWEWEEHASTAAWGNNDGDWMGVAYDIKKATEINSISCAIMQRPKNKVASTQVGYSFQYYLFFWNSEEGAWVEKLTSDLTTVTQEMLNTWVTLPMSKDGESEFMEPGYYVAAIQVFHNGGIGAANNIYRFTIGADQSHRYSYGKTLFRRYSDTGFSSSDEMEMIRMNINELGAPTSSEVVLNVDMKLPIADGNFNPSGDFVDVSGTFNAWGSTQMTDSDGDGIYTCTVPALPIFQNIAYTYRINGTTPEPSANRTYRVTFYNMVDDVFNKGKSMGIDAKSLMPSVNVYPNPAADHVTVSILNAKPMDTQVIMTNLQGQIVYRNILHTILDYTLPINLSGYAKGLYLLKVNNSISKIVIE